LVPEPASAGAGGRDAERVYEPSSRARPIVRLDEQTHNRQVGHFKWAWGRKEPWDPTAAQEEARMNMLAGFPCARRRSTIPAVGIAAFRLGAARALDGQHIRGPRVGDGSGSILPGLAGAVLLVRIQARPFRRPVSRSQPATRLAGSQLPGLHASWRRRPEANRSSAGLLLGLRDSDHGQVTLAPLSRLTAHDWKNHPVPLRECYPGWEFASPAEFASGS
jgi:hypothetical protein